MSICRFISCVVGKGCLLWLMHSLGKLVFSLLYFVLKGQTWLLVQANLDFPFQYSNPWWWIEHLFWVLVLEGLVGLHRIIQFQLLQHCWSGHRLELLWYWMVCFGNQQRSFCFFEIASKYCISDSFVDCDGYSISSKGFLPTVVDIMVIWVKFTHSSSL